MKCPECGKKLGGKNVCPKCGKRIEAAVEEIEVAYKEFPKSEYLEILTKPVKTGSDVEDASAKGKREGEKAADVIPKKSLKKGKSGNFRARWGREVVDKRALAFFLAGLLTAFGIVGLYLLLKTFF